MDRVPAQFKQIDVTRAIKGTLAAGLPVKRTEIDRTGKIVVIVDTGDPDDNEANDWD